MVCFYFSVQIDAPMDTPNVEQQSQAMPNSKKSIHRKDELFSLFILIIAVPS